MFIKYVTTSLILIVVCNCILKKFCFASDYNNISKFLNRILGMEVNVQNMLFKYFNATLSTVIMQAKRNGRWDMGILGDDNYSPLILYQW